jgi:cytochrome b6-f complex iron-sulfur subunit
MSATCTHACCNVTVCAGASCSSPILTAAACTKPTPVVLVAGGGPAFLCPCHGSQYSADGNVLNGPATRRLPSVALRLEGDDVLVDMSNAADPGARVVG